MARRKYSSKSRTYNRTYRAKRVSTKSKGAKRKRASSRGRTQTIKIVIEQGGLNAGRPAELLGMKAAPAKRKAKF